MSGELKLGFKPTVHYVPGESDVIAVDQFAFIYPVDHPSSDVSNTKQIQTSRVIRKEDDGTFETQNTIYKPV